MKNKRLSRERPNYIKLSGQLLWKLYVMSFEWLYFLLFFLIFIAALHIGIHFKESLIAILGFLFFATYNLCFVYLKKAYERASRPLKYKELLALPIFIYAITYYLVFQESMNRLIVRICKDIFG